MIGNREIQFVLAIIATIVLLMYLLVSCAPPDGVYTRNTNYSTPPVSETDNEYALFKYEDLNNGIVCYIATSPHSYSAIALDCVKR